MTIIADIGGTLALLVGLLIIGGIGAVLYLKYRAVKWAKDKITTAAQPHIDEAKKKAEELARQALEKARNRYSPENSKNEKQ